jgi:hypothetical protein
MFPDAETIYLPLADFPTTADPLKAKADVDAAIAHLNTKAKNFSSSRTFTRDYLDLLSQAETHAADKRWDEAHKTVWEATFFLNRAFETQAAARFRKAMGFYYAGWFLLLAAAGWGLKHLEDANAPVFYFGFSYWRYVLMGALGGITIAIWGLIKHSSDLDFDRAFSIWYWLKPVLGAVMGLIAVLTVMAGLFTVQGKPELNSKIALYILAFLAGFSERFFIRIIDRLMTTLFGGENTVTPAKPNPPKTKQ